MTLRRDPLQLAGWLLAALTVAFAAALAVDQRVIEGAPAWLKPAKFALSTSIYSFTLAWILRWLPDWPRLRRVAAATTAVVFVIEVVLIAAQAARGTTSHFNTSSIGNAVVFMVMGVSIAAQTVAAAAVAVALWRQPCADRAMGWALRLGMSIAVAGATIGGVMTQPTRAQLEAVRATHVMPRSGAHTVGGDDGGPGLPGTGWSTQHGDLRVPHFLGLHAMQALPLLALLVARRRRAAAAVRAVVGGAASYAVLVALLFAQALMGQPVIAPHGGMALALALWAVASAGFAVTVALDAARPADLGASGVV